MNAFLLTILSIFTFFTFEQGSGNLTLTIQNIPEQRGVVRVLLFNQATGFPDDVAKSYRQANVKAAGKSVQVVFEDLPKGQYALSVFHDVMETGKLRTNALGIPKDGYGFSNNATGSFGPPSFSKASFSVTTGKNQHQISLR